MMSRYTHDQLQDEHYRDKENPSEDLTNVTIDDLQDTVYQLDILLERLKRQLYG